MDPGAEGEGEREELSLFRAAECLLEECRMVLPGIQALFGFQLVATFNSAFAEKLSSGERHLHVLAIGLVATAIAIIMTPAAYHRQTGPREITARFIRLSTKLLLVSMGPLALGICIDFYLIFQINSDGHAIALAATFALFAVFALLWFALPRLGRRNGRARRGERPVPGR